MQLLVSTIVYIKNNRKLPHKLDSDTIHTPSVQSRLLQLVVTNFREHRFNFARNYDYTPRNY